MTLKFIHVDLFFRLPKGFDGDFDDLLALILKYRENNNHKEPQIKDYIAETYENNSISKYGHDRMMIQKLLSSDDRNLIGAINVLEVSDKDNI